MRLEIFKKRFINIWLPFLLIAQFIIWLISGGNLLGLIGGFTGLTYVALVGKNDRRNFYFNIATCLIFGYIAFQSGIYGDFIYQMVCLAIGIYGLKQKVWQNEASFVELSDKQWRYIVQLFMVFIVFASYFVHQFSVKPEMDLIVFSFGSLSAVLTALRVKDMMSFWVITNIVQVVLWFSVAGFNENAIVVASTYGLFLLNSVVTYFLQKGTKVIKA